jgi:hypothetical protein
MQDDGLTYPYFNVKAEMRSPTWASTACASTMPESTAMAKRSADVNKTMSLLDKIELDEASGSVLGVSGILGSTGLTFFGGSH